MNTNPTANDLALILDLTERMSRATYERAAAERPFDKDAYHTADRERHACYCNILDALSRIAHRNGNTITDVMNLRDTLADNRIQP